jgi:hypothetical protein
MGADNQSLGACSVILSMLANQLGFHLRLMKDFSRKINQLVLSEFKTLQAPKSIIQEQALRDLDAYI